MRFGWETVRIVERGIEGAWRLPFFVPLMEGGRAVVIGRFLVVFRDWGCRWGCKLGLQIGKSGVAKVGSEGGKKLSEETIRFWRLIARKPPPSRQRILSVTPYYI
jgi:hypothetical protein